MKRCVRRRAAPLLALAAALFLPMAAPEAVAEPAYSAQAVAQERAGIAEHRRLMLKILAEEEAGCRERFAATACLDDVRRRRRDALAPLRERELRLDESERRARADERRRAVANKLAAAASAPSATSGQAAPVPVSPPASGVVRPGVIVAASAPAAAVSRPAPILRVRRATNSASAAAARDADAAERVRGAERRREQTEVVRDRIERRQAEREAAGRRGDPLPHPGVASQPAR